MRTKSSVPVRLNVCFVCHMKVASVRTSLLKEVADFNDRHRLSFVVLNLLSRSSLGPESFDVGKRCFS